MFKRISFRFFFLFFSIFSFSLAVFIFNYDFTKFGFKPSEKYKEEITENTKKKIKYIENTLKKIQTDFFTDSNIFFNHSSFQKGEMIYIYKNNECIFWTDYHTHISSEIIKTTKTWQVFQLKEGVFLMHKQQVEKNGTDYQFIYMLPLHYNYQIENEFLITHLNQEIFAGLNEKNQQIYLKPESGAQSIIHPKGVFLFSIKIDESAQQSYYILVAWAILLTLGFTSLLLATIQWMRYFEDQQKYFTSSFILISFLFIVRGGMLYAEFPFRYISLDFFNSKFFASSNIYPSFGDLFLNICSIFILIIYIFRIFQKFSIFHFLSKLKMWKATILVIILLSITHLAILFSYKTLANIYEHSQWNFDITSSIQIDYFKIVYILIFIMLISSYFLLCHLVLVIISRLKESLRGSINYYISGVCVLFLFLTLFTEENAFFIYFINAFYTLIVIDFYLYKGLRYFNYKSYLYLFFVSFIGSLMGAYTIYQDSSKQEMRHKKHMAQKIVTHHDPQEEFLLAKVGKQLQKDLFIKDKFTSSFSFVRESTKRELIRQKIRRVYLNSYFDKYDINISLFDEKGRGDDDNRLIGNFQTIYETFNKKIYETEHPSLFFINNLKEHFLSRYLHFIPIKKEKRVVGYIILNLTSKKFRENSVYPKLLEKRHKQNAFADKLYSYAVFDDNGVKFSVGKLNYENAPYNQIRYMNLTTNEPITIGDYNHLGMKSMDGYIVIVSSPNTNVWTIFTNFSYFFLMLLSTFFVIIMVVNLYWRIQNKAFSFSSKIQTYLNIAYFLPLAMVSIATLSLIKDSYEEDLKASYQEKANKIKYHLSSLMVQKNEGMISDRWFRQNVLQLSKYANVDVNLYEPQGKLIVSSQPLLFETHLLSNYINPRAKRELILQHTNQSLFEEYIGKFNYNAVYVRLISPETGKLLGVLSIPFFNSREALDKKKIDVIATVLNIFIVIFIIIVILSYVSFKSLTTPLELIATKLKRTSFSGQNEPLEWRVNDEIGILVNEYNAMLMKLEESKKALSRSEKESAWREMAQQVAHEIKNPLTPMKLKLQHLLYVLGDSEQDQKLKKSMNVLLQQVETLNDIATSFSSFAKMPIPENVRFNITNSLKNIIQLYSANKDIILKKDILTNEIWVSGDEKLLGRILTNLILNGMQAVASDKEPVIELFSSIDNGQVLIEVKDNGDGIPEDIQHKVFLPNFSTKYTGSGIGLAVAKRGIEHAGGKIWFETKIQEGTSFFILLPIV